MTGPFLSGPKTFVCFKIISDFTPIFLLSFSSATTFKWCVLIYLLSLIVDFVLYHPLSLMLNYIWWFLFIDFTMAIFKGAIKNKVVIMNVVVVVVISVISLSFLPSKQFEDHTTIDHRYRKEYKKKTTPIKMRHKERSQNKLLNLLWWYYTDY